MVDQRVLHLKYKSAKVVADDAKDADAKDEKKVEPIDMVPFDQLIRENNETSIWDNKLGNPYGFWKLGVFSAAALFFNFYKFK